MKINRALYRTRPIDGIEQVCFNNVGGSVREGDEENI